MNTQQSGGKKGRILLVLIIIAVTAVSVWWFLLREQNDDSTLRLYGNVDIREVELAFRQPGRLTEMLFDEGDQVNAGEIMAQLDAGPYRDKLAAAKAELQAAQAELDKLHSGNRPQEVLQAEATVAQTQANYHEAERNYQRQSALLESGATSQRAVDAALAMRNQSAANLASAKAALSLVEAGFRDEDIAAGEARVAVAQAAVAQAETALADTDLVAPSDATVLARVREPGSMVASNSTVYSLSLRDPVYVRAYVSEPNLGHIAPGTQVRVFTDSSDQAYQGQIGFISPRAEFTPKSVETTDLRTDLVYRLRITVTDANQDLRQGMPVTVEVDQSGNKSVSGQ
ncbi:secretion protein HlyD [Marinicella gelatinilytica]|uniref:secretion protein HlyD n=1 Tax=Marinicella gelatinilytica TaxID=2996017 RepID=UPI002260EBC7|nr:secretion protein HlyD [Marinicella gelatinilytica]MCX7546102.1 secretion protein HlyD [Marinicella gelatinilytica]